MGDISCIVIQTLGLTVLLITSFATNVLAKKCLTIYLTRSNAPRYILSSGYPKQYDNNAEECWIVDTSKIPSIHGEKYKILLNLEDMYLKDNPKNGCKKDFLQVFDGKFLNSSVLGRFCGSEVAETPPILSSGDHVLLSFNSDKKDTGAGFQIRVQAVAKPAHKPRHELYTNCNAFYVESINVDYILPSIGDSIDKEMCYLFHIHEQIKGSEQLTRVQIHEPHGPRTKSLNHRLKIFDGDTFEEKSLQPKSGHKSVGYYSFPSSSSALLFHIKSHPKNISPGYITVMFQKKIKESNQILRQKRSSHYGSYSSYSSYRYSYYGHYTFGTPYIPINAIAGAVTALIVLIGLAIFFIIYCYRAYKRNRIAHGDIDSSNSSLSSGSSRGSVHVRRVPMRGNQQPRRFGLRPNHQRPPQQQSPRLPPPQRMPQPPPYQQHPSFNQDNMPMSSVNQGYPPYPLPPYPTHQTHGMTMNSHGTLPSIGNPTQAPPPPYPGPPQQTTTVPQQNQPFTVSQNYHVNNNPGMPPPPAGYAEERY